MTGTIRIGCLWDDRSGEKQTCFSWKTFTKASARTDVFDLGNLENRQVTVNSIEDYLNSTYIEHGALKIILTKENVIFSDRKSPYTSAHYENGFTSAISSIRRNETSPFTFHKTLNYGDNILEKESLQMLASMRKSFWTRRVRSVKAQWATFSL